MLIFNINNAATDLTLSNAVRLRRARTIASVLIREEIPVPPLPNPITGISHHRIQLRYNEATDWVVELFIRDTDLYMLGFRRGMAIGEEVHWGTFFAFDDLIHEVPPFLEPVTVMMGIDSAHPAKL